MTYNDIWRPLVNIYGEGEAKAIAKYVLDVSFGLSTADIYGGAVERMDADDERRLASMLGRLMRSEPVQYVAGVADFCGRAFYVDGNVLIPRPETEELCQWVIDDCGKVEGWTDDRSKDVDILDIGTGSGCIAVTLALDIADARVTAWDISEGALAVAKRNVRRMNAHVDFCKVDVFNPPEDKERWNVIVSNPPYICAKEQATMHRNVIDYEPHSALFVPDGSPIVFYQAIACYARLSLRHRGTLFFEINPLYVKDIQDMLVSNGFSDIEIRIDSFGKERMVKAVKP